MGRIRAGVRSRDWGRSRIRVMVRARLEVTVEGLQLLRVRREEHAARRLAHLVWRAIVL